MKYFLSVFLFLSFAGTAVAHNMLDAEMVSALNPRYMCIPRPVLIALPSTVAPEVSSATALFNSFSRAFVRERGKGGGEKPNPAGSGTPCVTHGSACIYYNSSAKVFLQGLCSSRTCLSRCGYVQQNTSFDNLREQCTYPECKFISTSGGSYCSLR